MAEGLTDRRLPHHSKSPTLQYSRRLPAVRVALVLALFVGNGCNTQTASKGEKEVNAPTSINLRSEAFQAGQPIPVKHTGEGEDVSPPLTWDGVPSGAAQLALICDDPDAPTDEPWVHWVIYRIPGDVRALNEGLAPTPQLESPSGALQGRNSWPQGQTTGYRGPLPPPGHGVHHYHFKIYALDTALNLEPGLDKKVLLEAMSDHVLAEGELIGTYERK